MTEVEARTKWCCKGSEVTGYCQASACMAWRWGGRRGHTLHNERTEADNKEEGFCGLAGRPI